MKEIKLLFDWQTNYLKYLIKMVKSLFILQVEALMNYSFIRNPFQKWHWFVENTFRLQMKL